MYLLPEKKDLGKTRSSVSQSLPTGSVCGAHSQGLASTSAKQRGNFGSPTNDTEF